MQSPYLVQRGTLKPLKEVTGIDALVAFDYMGSSEFEFGALPKALKSIIGVLPKLGFLPLPNIEFEGKHLWVLCLTEDEDALREFFDMITKDRPVRMKEAMYWGDRLGDNRINFWWDLENNWMATFGEDEIQQVHDALVAVKKRKGW